VGNHPWVTHEQVARSRSRGTRGELSGDFAVETSASSRGGEAPTVVERFDRLAAEWDPLVLPRLQVALARGAYACFLRCKTSIIGLAELTSR
jgi:hypothetical protein